MGEEGSCYRSWLGWACMSFDRGFVENGGGKGGVCDIRVCICWAFCIAIELTKRGFILGEGGGVLIWWA